MKKLLLSAMLIFSLLITANTCLANHNSENLSAEEALEKLIQGNKRFVELEQKRW